jgi:uncharacterized protein YndB with AHSA1/START domain
MAGIDVEIIINGPQEKVFDVITSARYWPQWHVLTRAVAGVIERPFQMGDRIYEFVRTPTGPAEREWHITEYDRPRRVKLQDDHGTAITYTFEGRADGTVFRRGIVVGSVPMTNDTERTSDAQLKALVENILWREQMDGYVSGTSAAPPQPTATGAR